jgi:hypothetical protein
MSFAIPNPRMQSHMTHSFSQVPKAEIPRSTFDRSFGYKTTFDAGYLIPFFIEEALPGDTFNYSLNALARLATPIFPIMDNIFMDTHFFSVPYRLVWDNFVKMQGEQRNPGDSTDFIVPTMESPVGGYAVGSLEDYMGLPILKAGVKHSSLWHRAYNLIYNEWFRDQNLQPSLNVPLTDGGDLHADYTLRRRGKRPDYFTSCLPFPQKGPGVSIPLGGTAPVKSTGLVGSQIGFLDSANVPRQMTVGALNNPATLAGSTPTATMFVDLSSATAATINSLRQAFQIQKIYERDARGGTRYTESVRAHFGVSSPDARLQRPEFLGGGSTPVNIAPIPQTSGTGGYTGSPQGNLAAIGTAQISGRNGFTASFTEHCLVIGLISVRADLTYQQGLERKWSRSTRLDFALPALTHIGEQAVLQKEIFASGVPSEDDKVFGYQERYAEYRYKPSQITGLFRSTAPQPLDAWHLAQEFATAPVLDSTFISEDPPLDRVIAVTTEPHFLFDSYSTFRCTRPLPVYGVPGLIDHF